MSAAANPAVPASQAAGERAAVVGEVCGGGVREARGVLVAAAGDAGLRSDGELPL